jgi:hypothetical protein
VTLLQLQHCSQASLNVNEGRQGGPGWVDKVREIWIKPSDFEDKELRRRK